MKDNKHSIQAKILGSSLSGILEISLFHPVDTISKRLMHNKSNINKKNYSNILFKEHNTSNMINKYKSLYTGAKFATGYKVLQRTYKYGGQSILSDYFGKFSNNKLLNQAVSGAVIGAGEVILLPLDVLKIQMQTNAKSLTNKNFSHIVKEQGFGLYRGAGMTMMRNIPGSFALFGANSFMKEKVFRLENSKQSTFFQNFISSTFGAFCSITVASPMDVIKTRIQAETKKKSSIKLITDLVKNEGIGAFFRGLGPKLLIVGPKLTFSFTVAQQLIQFFDKK
jgi:hypothetical protein